MILVLLHTVLLDVVGRDSELLADQQRVGVQRVALEGLDVVQLNLVHRHDLRGLLHKGAEALRVAQGVALSPFFLRRGDLTRLQGEDDSVVGLALRILLLERLQLLGEG